MAKKNEVKTQAPANEAVVMDRNLPEIRPSNNSVSTTVRQETPEILRQDILVPYVVLAQGTSDAVQERKAEMGDIIRSTNFEKLGDPDTPMEAIILHYPKSEWVLEEKPKGANRFEYRGMENRNAANETLPWTWWQDEDGHHMEAGAKGATEWRRVKRLSVFAILPKDIEANNLEMKKLETGDLPDVNKALTPVILSFRSTSFKAGKELTTFFTKAQSMGVPVWRYKIQLTDVLEQNDQGSFYVWKVDVNKASAVAKEDVPLVQKWAEIVSQGTLKTDDDAETSNYDNSTSTGVDSAISNSVV